MRACLVLTVAVALNAAPARGDAPGDAKATAVELFDQGQALADAGRWEEACAKFQASLDADPQTGTRLNVADCYERIGKLASAWALYVDVAEADATGDLERRDYAQARATALEPRLPRMVIAVAAGAQPAGLVVSRDRLAVPPGALAAPIYVDPGPHLITARAPDRQTLSITVTIAERETRRVEIPTLSVAPELVAAARSAHHRAILGAAFGGAGAVAVGVGLGYGWSARQTWNRAFDSGECDRSTLTCTSAGQAATDRSRARATVADVVVAGGLGLLAAGVYLYVTRGPEHRVVVPVALDDQLGVAVLGTF